MQVTAYGPQKILRLDEPGSGGGADHPGLDQILDSDHAVLIPGDPKQQMQIPKTAFAFLDVGFQHIADIAHAFVALIAFLQLGLEKFVGGSLHHAGLKFLDQIGVKILIAPQPAHFQKRRADGHVFLGVADALFRRSGRLSDLQTQIPQQIQQPFHHLFVPGGAFVGG